jgi:hypothetical protein
MFRSTEPLAGLPSRNDANSLPETESAREALACVNAV